jgi:20S proteasome alpha/beta subunit
MLLSLICGILFVYVAAVTGNRRNGAFDKSVNMFSDEGELLQVKYARNAGLQGGSVVCATSSSNDLLVCIPNQPELPVLLDRRSVDKISKVDDEIWFAFSGLAGDGRALISQARKYCIEYRSQFGCSPTGRSVASVVSQLQHDSTVSGSKLLPCMCLSDQTL